VSTRNKSSAVNSEQSDTSTAASTTTTTRSSRRSLGTVPTEVLTPTRRSRRLSNSSVESISSETSNAASRRSVRGRSSVEEVEVLAVKKRKLTEKVETLGAISEEKNIQTADEKQGTDTDQVSQVKDSNPPVINIDDEVQLPCTKNPAEVVTIFSDNEETVTTSVDNKFVLVMEEVQDSVDVVQEPAVSVKNEVKEPETELTAQEQTAAVVSEEIKITEVIENAEPILKEEISAPQIIEEESNPKVKAVLDRINAFNALDNQIPVQFDKKIMKNPLRKLERKPLKKKSASKKIPAQENVKKALPCGADVMTSIPRGKSVSGREWKDPKSNPRYLYKDKGMKIGLSKMHQLKNERSEVRELENRMKEEEKQRRVDLAARRELNKKRTEENARKNEIVQVIKNTNKIKRMNKKQLKLIQKRDTSE